MPQVATITINDGAATPAAHNFTPAGPDENGWRTYYDQSGGIQAGYPMLKARLVRGSPTATRGTPVNKVQWEIYVPTLDEVATVPTLAYFLTSKGEYVLPTRCTAADRDDILAYTKNLMGHAVFGSLVGDLEGIWG